MNMRSSRKKRIAACAFYALFIITPISFRIFISCDSLEIGDLLANSGMLMAHGTHDTLLMMFAVISYNSSNENIQSKFGSILSYLRFLVFFLFALSLYL